MAYGTSAGTRVYIGPATQATDLTALAGLSYVEVGGVESVGEIGPQKQDVTFTPLNGEAVQHLPGSLDNGALPLVCARDPLDAGQQDLDDAAATKLEFAVKIVVPDAADGNDTDSVYYARGPIMGSRTNIGGANQVRMKTWNIGLNVFLEEPSEAVSGS